MSGAGHMDDESPEVREVRKKAHAFLRKPFPPAELLNTVHRLLHPAPDAGSTGSPTASSNL